MIYGDYLEDHVCFSKCFITVIHKSPRPGAKISPSKWSKLHGWKNGGGHPNCYAPFGWFVGILGDDFSIHKSLRQTETSWSSCHFMLLKNGRLFNWHLSSWHLTPWFICCIYIYAYIRSQGFFPTHIRDFLKLAIIFRSLLTSGFWRVKVANLT